MRNALLSLLTGILFLVSTPSRADMMVPLSIQAIAARAQLILQGKVLSKTVMEDTNGNIVTKVELQVEDVWKGSLATNIFTIVYDGGILGDRGVSVSGGVEYEVGEEVVAFLVLNDRGEGITVGLTQGKFKIWTDAATGEKLVANHFHGRHPGAPNRASIPSTATVHPPPNVINRLTLANLKQQAVGGGK